MRPKTILTALLPIVFSALALSFTADAVETNKTTLNLKPYKDSLVSGDLLAKSHGDAELVCKDCHPDPSSHPEKGKFKDELCLECHELKEVDKKVVYKYHGTPVHPHGQHVGELYCADCHSMHSKSTLKCAECHVQPWMKTLPKRWEKPE